MSNLKKNTKKTLIKCGTPQVNHCKKILVHVENTFSHLPQLQCVAHDKLQHILRLVYENLV